MALQAESKLFAVTFYDNQLKVLINVVGTLLFVLGYVATENGGFFGKIPCFIRDDNIVDYVIQNIRAELLDDGMLSNNMIALVSLFDARGC